MKSLTNIQNVKIYSPKILTAKKALVVSDIHIPKEADSNHLLNLIYSPHIDFDGLNYILIPGDITNEASLLKDIDYQRKVLQQISQLTQGIKTIVSLGNHDQMEVSKDGPRAWSKVDPRYIEDLLGQLNNVEFLDNKKTYSDNKDIKFGAFSPNFEYYEGNGESPEAFKEQFDAQHNPDKFEKDQFNVLLTHEPQNIIKASKEKNECPQENTDLVISGHMHNGLMPHFAKKIARNRGLISPQKKLFPKYAEGCTKEGSTVFVINGAVNAHIETPAINNLYPAEATLIELNPEEEKHTR